MPEAGMAPAVMLDVIATNEVRAPRSRGHVMDPASIAAALLSSQAGQTQFNLAAKMIKMNADAQTSIAQMVEAAAQSANQFASLPAGVGGKLNTAA
jgi:hypothetical protein